MRISHERGGARVAALCLAHGAETLLTRDRDFSLFEQLRTRDPLRRSRRFAGTGTQKLTAEGQRAIRERFVRSFGPA